MYSGATPRVRTQSNKDSFYLHEVHSSQPRSIHTLGAEVDKEDAILAFVDTLSLWVLPILSESGLKKMATGRMQLSASLGRKLFTLKDRVGPETF